MYTSIVYRSDTAVGIIPVCARRLAMHTIIILYVLMVLAEADLMGIGVFVS